MDISLCGYHEILPSEVKSSDSLFRLNFSVNPFALVTKEPGANVLGMFCRQDKLRLVRKTLPVSAYAFACSAFPSTSIGASSSSTETPISTFGF